MSDNSLLFELLKSNMLVQPEDSDPTTAMKRLLEKNLMTSEMEALFTLFNQLLSHKESERQAVFKEIANGETLSELYIVSVHEDFFKKGSWGLCPCILLKKDGKIDFSKISIFDVNTNQFHILVARKEKSQATNP